MQILLRRRLRLSLRALQGRSNLQSSIGDCFGVRPAPRNDSSFLKKTGHAAQGLVEFALLLPVLLLILMGAIDLGRILDAYVVMTNAAREGARYGIAHSTDPNGIQQKVIAEANNSGYTITSAMITVIDPNTNPGQPLQVVIDFPFSLVSTYIFRIQTLNVHVSATMGILQ